VPERRASAAGAIIGVVVGVALVGGIAGTPLYLANLQTDQGALDAAVQGDIETIRRAVLNLDSRLNDMAWVYDSASGDAGPADAAMRTLLADNAKLLERAEEGVARLEELRRGTALAGAHLAVNRIAAILHLTTGKIDNNRAALEEELASALWREAERRADGVAASRRKLELARARKPIGILSRSVERALELETRLEEQRFLLSKLKRVMATKEAKIAELDTTAREARSTLAGLDERGLTSSAYRSAYLDFSSAARAAEAEAAFLRNGSSEGAVLGHGEGDDPLRTYREWASEMSVRDLAFGVALLEEQLAPGERMKGDLADRQAAFERLTAELDSVEGKIQASIRSLTSKVDDLLGKADRHLESTKEARGEASKALGRASNCVGQAITAAKRRTTNASATLRETGRTEDELLQRISGDGDTEAALLCLRAEIAYHAALLRLNQMNALQARFDALAYISGPLGRDGPPEILEELDAQRGEAAKELALAIESLDTARNMVRSTNIRGSDGRTISGNNYLWQIDVGQAAVRLLQANLAADRLQREEAQNQAYDLLTQAAQGREQSPLLSPAIDTLLYLQRTAR
jgi:hypothetical protein